MTDLKIETGYKPGLLGAITSLHARYYSDKWGFGMRFEATVAKGLAEFLPRLSAPNNQIWQVSVDGVLAASIAIDGEDLGENQAHLRWFIIGAPLRGTGLGTRLLDIALDFSDSHHFDETHLWTFKGLDAAKHLYTSRGFSLAEESDGDQWGKIVREQKFIRANPSLSP